MEVGRFWRSGFAFFWWFLGCLTDAFCDRIGFLVSIGRNRWIRRRVWFQVCGRQQKRSRHGCHFSAVQLIVGDSKKNKERMICNIVESITFKDVNVWYDWCFVLFVVIFPFGEIMAGQPYNFLFVWVAVSQKINYFGAAVMIVMHCIFTHNMVKGGRKYKIRSV